MPWDDAAPLAGDEVASLREAFVESLRNFWKGSDQVISYTNKRRKDAYIWQTIDDEDNEFIADRLIAMGTRNKTIAAAVRGIVAANYQLRIGTILLPRFLQTVQFYADNGGLMLGFGMPGRAAA